METSTIIILITVMILLIVVALLVMRMLLKSKGETAFKINLMKGTVEITRKSE